eukprot:jgi/Mesvir1/25436/Mv01713-RA.1
MAKFCQMSPAEVLTFLAPSRPHMAQGLIEMDAQLSLDYAGQAINMPPEVMMSLAGGVLSSSEFLKVEGTALAELLRSEGEGREGDGGGGSIGGRPPSALSPDLDNVLDEEGLLEEEGGEEELLRRAASVQGKRASHRGRGAAVSSTVEADASGNKEEEADFLAGLYQAVAEGAAGNTEEESAGAGASCHRLDPATGGASPEGSAPLGPYSSNLDYLQDCFQVVVTRMRIQAAAAEASDPRSARMLGDRKSPEAVLRELRSTEAAQVRKVARRVAMTAAVATAGSGGLPEGAGVLAEVSYVPATLGTDELSSPEQDDAGGDVSGAGGEDVALPDGEGDDDVSEGGSGSQGAAGEASEGRRGAIEEGQYAQDMGGATGGDGGGKGAGGASRTLWLPRVEVLAKRLRLTTFEKWVVLTLVGGIMSADVRRLSKASSVYTSSVSFDVGTLIAMHSTRLSEQVACRRVFYRKGTLIRHNIIRVSEKRFGGGDLMDCVCEIDRRMVDFALNLDTEFGELVEGGSLYAPTSRMDAVVLPPATKSLILHTVENFSVFRRLRARLGLDNVIAYGRGLVLLFHGGSGTGKTLTANALAGHLGKRLLLLTASQFAQGGAAEMLQLAFREAKVSDAVVFLDECEVLLQKRDSGSFVVNALLAELEKHDELLILATNRPGDLDPAVHRRISLEVEFGAPDMRAREAIWRAHLPPDLPLSADVDLRQLAMDYELTGGLIKNAVLGALSLAIQRDQSDVIVTGADLQAACRLQIRTALKTDPGCGDRGGTSFKVPRKGLASLLVDAPTMAVLRSIVSFLKAKKSLPAWGFFGEGGPEDDDTHLGVIALFMGPPGTGKSHAAEAIAFETGVPLVRLQCESLLLQHRSAGKAMGSLFQDARNLGAVVLVEEGDKLLLPVTHALPSGLEREALSLLQQHTASYPHCLVLVCHRPDALSGVHANDPPLLLRRVDHVVQFAPPSREQREQLWRQLVPDQAPLGPCVNFGALAGRFELTGAGIQRALLRGAAGAALRGMSRRQPAGNLVPEPPPARPEAVAESRHTAVDERAVNAQLQPSGLPLVAKNDELERDSKKTVEGWKERDSSCILMADLEAAAREEVNRALHPCWQKWVGGNSGMFS